jgi:hypothetical protein
MKHSDPAIAVAPSERGAAVKSAELAWSMLVEPGRALAALRDRPGFWFPLLVLVAANVAVLLWYFGIVDYAWLADQMAQAHAPATGNAAPSEPLLPKSALMGLLLGSVVVGMPLMRLLEATYFALAARVANVPLTFRHWMSLACWTAWPYVITVVAMLQPLLMSRGGQISVDDLNLFSLNELVFHVPQASPWHGLLSTLTVLHPWAWYLTVRGVRQWSGRSPAFSTVFALLPELVVYGGWALFALL